MNINKLKFNAAKTEIIVMRASHTKNKLSMPHIELGNTFVPISTVAKNIKNFAKNIGISPKYEQPHAAHLLCGIFPSPL